MTEQEKAKKITSSIYIDKDMKEEFDKRCKDRFSTPNKVIERLIEKFLLGEVEL